MTTARPPVPWHGPRQGWQATLQARLQGRLQPWMQPLLVLPGLVSVGGLVLAAPPAANLPDPTRPPPALQVAQTARNLAARLPPNGDGSLPTAGAPQLGAHPLAGQAAGAMGTEAPPTGPVLQAVQLPSRGAPTALLDGRLVKVGDSVGGLQVTAIDGQGITLKGANGSQRLSLLGRDSKQPAGSIVISRSASYAPGTPGMAPAPAPSGGAPRGELPTEPGPPRAPTAPPSANNGDIPTATAPDSPVAVAGKPRP